VLSTVHTNSAAATVTRLRDMGVEDYLLTATLKAVLAQRLVRRLCAKCKVAEATPAALLPAALIDRHRLERLTQGAPIVLYRSVGCPECRGTGFRGRLAIGELLVPSAAIDQLIFERADHATIERAAIEDGMRPILDSGLLAVIEGETTLEEVLRSVHSDA